MEFTGLHHITMITGDAQKNVDFSFEMTLADHKARFRANLFYCERHLAACFRIVPTEIPDQAIFEDEAAKPVPTTQTKA